MNICKIHGMKGENKIDVQLSVVLKNVNTIRTERGQTMAFAQAQDDTGSIECIFFPAIYSKSKQDLVEGACLFIEGTVNLCNSPRKVFPDRVKINSKVTDK